MFQNKNVEHCLHVLRYVKCLRFIFEENLSLFAKEMKLYLFFYSVYSFFARYYHHLNINHSIYTGVDVRSPKRPVLLVYGECCGII